MKKRLWWSMLFCSAALLVTSVTAFAARPTVGTVGTGAGNAPIATNQVPARIPANTTSGTTTLYKAWEGVNSTNYVDRSQQIDTENLADVAVGPADILTVTNKRIVRYPNPNTIVNAAQATTLPQGQSMSIVNLGGSNYAWVNSAGAFNTILANQSNPGYSATFMEPRQANLDNWLGDGILNVLCPTLPRRNYNCLIDHATARYDSLQGRFLVLFTVTETGIKFFGQAPSEARKASWVLAVSKYSVFSLGTNPTDLFIPPVPGTGTVLGGANTTNWYFYFGDTLGTIGSDGFGNDSVLGTSTPCPTTACVGAGNINAIPGVHSFTRVQPATGAPGQGSTFSTLLNTPAQFNCSVDAATGALPTTDGSVCYFPTSARLGIDNDSIYITSSVVNTNFVATISVNGVTVPAPQFAGTRLRVLKKLAIYNGLYAAAGNNLAATKTDRAFGCSTAPDSGQKQPDIQCGLYDLFAYSAVTGGAPTPLTTPAGPYGPSPFTLAPGYGFATNGGTVPFDNPAFCEPQQLRGRAVASFSNNLVADKSFGYIECIKSVPFELRTAGALNPFTPATGSNFASNIYVLPIRSRPVLTADPTSNSLSGFGVAYYPELVGAAPGTTGVPATAGTIFHGQPAFIEAFQNAPDPYLCPSAQISNPPNPYCQVPNGSGVGTITPSPATGTPGVAQGDLVKGTFTAINGNVLPNLFVGDDRPQKVVFREGFLYDARVKSTVGSIGNVDANLLSSTVAYDILNKLCDLSTAAFSNCTLGATTVQRVLGGEWQNTNAFAPMYDTPANVTLSGVANPINLLPWLEKLFVATTYPALSQTDPRNVLASAAAPWGQLASTTTPAECAGAIPGVNSGVPSVNGNVAWPGLFDMHCGLDGYDTHSPFRDPISGQLRDVVSLTVRNNSTTDPNNGSLWNYGLYAGYRDGFVNGPGQWGSYIANYDLSFPQGDPYGNGSLNYTDVAPPVACNCPNPPTSNNDQTAIAVYTLRNANVIPPPCGTGQPAGCSNTVTAVAGSPGNINSPITRIEMVTLVVKSMADEQGITDFLNATGACANSFGDITPGCNGGAPGGTVTNTSGTLNGADVGVTGKPSSGWRYAEYAYRRGLTKGCAGTDDISRKFCPSDQLQRYQAFAFIVRAKMNNVFPTSLNGCPALSFGAVCTTLNGDNFGLFFQQTTPFSDVPDAANPASPEWAAYTNKGFELRITNGTVVPTFAANGTVATQGTFGPTQALTRAQVMAFLARGFFY